VLILLAVVVLIVLGTYKTVIMGLGETALVAAIGFHALNGLRIILIDFWSKGAKYQRAMFWIVIVVWVVLMLGFAPVHLANVFSEGAAK
jgi:succinate dehydrogenase / fumarate reductase cytochrome b subunit